MEPTSDDIQKLLDSLAKESPMVISTAYAYAKNYVEYGEDITKAWTTATQQVSILQKVRRKVWTIAYEDFKENYEDLKKDCENRLKVDMVAMLEELKAEIEELKNEPACCQHFVRGIRRSSEVIQEKIDELKGEENGNNN